MNTNVASPRFPIRFDPVAGESFDGWIDAYAQRLLISGRELGRALGLPPRLLRLHGANVAKGDAGLDAERIAARACGADPALIGPLWIGLARYDRLIAERVARADARRRAVTWFGRVLRPMVSSRWCPICLAQSSGRWLMAWRLPWYLACPTHQTMLASGCPACGGTQRYAGLRVEYVPDLLTSCSRPTAGQAGPCDHRCRQDLTIIATAAAPDALLALQAEMIAILDPTVSETEALASSIGSLTCTSSPSTPGSIYTPSTATGETSTALSAPRSPRRILRSVTRTACGCARSPTATRY